MQPVHSAYLNVTLGFLKERYAPGKLHFVKFETSKVAQALDFIKANCLHMYQNGSNGSKRVVRIKATGGGAFKFADIFQVLLEINRSSSLL